MANFQKGLSPKPDKKYSNIIHILKGRSFIYQKMFTVKPEVNYIKRYMRSKKPHFLTQRSWAVYVERFDLLTKRCKTSEICKAYRNMQGLQRYARLTEICKAYVKMQGLQKRCKAYAKSVMANNE